jgi:hypothetical protein
MDFISNLFLNEVKVTRSLKIPIGAWNLITRIGEKTKQFYCSNFNYLQRNLSKKIF